jgi:RNA-directed DNA polymerase
MSALEKSDLPEVAEKRANKAASAAAELVERRGGAKENAELQSTVRTQSRAAVSQAQARIREAVVRNRRDKLTALLHHLTVDVLRASFLGLKKSAAPGVDEMTWTEYSEGLEENLSDLHSRVQTGAYRALPSRRTYIPKPDGRQRPLGIAALEDKIVQAAVVAILTPIYEAEFLGFSYGFRPKRNQHQALDALAFGIGRRRINWVLDCDVQSFFDKVSQSWLMRFIEHRIGDRRIIRLIVKWLTAGVLEEGRLIVTEEGTPQGAVISPLLANIYLHYVYDLWVHQWRQRCATGDVIVVRYADDTIAGFEHRHEAERFLADLKARLARFGLTLHPDKTRLIEFGRYAIANRRSQGLGKPESFEFLGFTHYCATRRSGSGFVLGRKPVRKRMRVKLREIKDQLLATRHDGIEVQGQWLAQVLRGWLAYYAVPMSGSAITAFRQQIIERWRRAIRRRSQKHRLTWLRMKTIADRYLPRPRVLHPWPEQRFLVSHPRWEPGAVAPHAGFCAGGGR